MPTSASGCWQVATRVTGETCVYLSVRNSPRVGGGGRVGGGWGRVRGWGRGMEIPFLIENFMKHGSWTVSHAQTESQRPHIKKIWTKMKTYGQG
jgi:hypothetical protein